MSRSRHKLAFVCPVYSVIPLMIFVLMGCATDLAQSRMNRSVRFESGIGRLAFDLIVEGDSIDVVDRDGVLILECVRDGSELRVSKRRGGAESRIVQSFEGERPSLRYIDDRSGEDLFELKLESDGDLKLADGAGETLYKLKLRKYGFKVVDAKDETTARIRLSGDRKISIRNAENVTYLTTRDDFPVAAAAVLSVPDLSFSQAAGLAIGLWIWPGESS